MEVSKVMDIVWLMPVLGLLVGCALRTLLPYVVTGLETIRDKADWGAWPKFEPRYLSSFALAAIAYGIALAAVPGTWQALLQLAFVQAVALAYAGQDLARQTIKAAAGKRSAGARMLLLLLSLVGPMLVLGLGMWALVLRL